MKYLAFSALLLTGLASCGPHSIQGPAGCQATGPTVRGHQITYTVTGYQEGNVAMQKFLDDLVYSGVSIDNEVGSYEISVIDQRTGFGIAGKRAQIYEDELDRRHKINFMSY